MIAGDPGSIPVTGIVRSSYLFAGAASDLALSCAVFLATLAEFDFLEVYLTVAVSVWTQC